MSTTIESTLVENRVFPPDERAQKGARIAGMAAYEALCKEAETDLQAFWASRAREIPAPQIPLVASAPHSPAPATPFRPPAIRSAARSSFNRVVSHVARVFHLFHVFTASPPAPRPESH